MKGRRIGVLLGAGALFLTMAGTALAGGATQAWDGNGWGANGIDNVICGSDTPPGTMLWIFHDSTDGANPVMTINGTVPTQTVLSHNGNTYHIQTAWVDAPSTTNTFVTYFAGTADQPLTLSHGCPGTTTTTTSSSTTTTPTTTTTSSNSTTTTSSNSTTTTSVSTQSTTSTVSTETTSTQSTTQLTETTVTPQGSVEAETGKPVVTPPSTDAIGAASSTPSGAWNIVLALGAVLSLSILVLTPMAKSRRRK